MRTIAITHKVHESNVTPFTASELEHLIREPLIAVGTNWRGQSESAWAADTRAREEFDLFDGLAAQGGLVIANYEALGAYQRIVGRVVPTATRQPEMWQGLRVLRVVYANRIDARSAGIDDLRVLPGRTIVDVSQRAAGRVERLLGMLLHS